MPMLQAFLYDLNRRFDNERITDSAREAKAFAPGQGLDAGFVVKKGSAAYKVVQAYIKKMPDQLAESVRGTIYGALTAKQPKPITFAWAPGYDFQLHVWDYGCGMTVLVQGRYPADKTLNRGDAP